MNRELLTRQSFSEGKSRSTLSFNQQDDVNVSSRHKSAVFPAEMLSLKAEEMFDGFLAHLDQNSLLCELMRSRGSDKATNHNYSKLYFRLFESIRHLPLTFVEIGIGTPNQDVKSHMRPDYPFGASLRAWSDFFTHEETKIFGGDIDTRVLFQDRNINTYYFNQLDPESMRAFFEDNGIDKSGADVILDDGLHQFNSNISMLIACWQFVKPGGLYIIEDIGRDAYPRICDFLCHLNLGADMAMMELPSFTKEDNRVIALQKMAVR